jgi:hypothetical protein
MFDWTRHTDDAEFERNCRTIAERRGLAVGEWQAVALEIIEEARLMGSDYQQLAEWLAEGEG